LSLIAIAFSGFLPLNPDLGFCGLQVKLNWQMRMARWRTCSRTRTTMHCSSWVRESFVCYSKSHVC